VPGTRCIDFANSRTLNSPTLTLSSITRAASITSSLSIVRPLLA
jgi:hypothetical protein